MEVGAVIPTGFAPNQALDARAARGATEKARGEAATAAAEQIRKDAAEAANRARSESLRANQEARSAKPAQTSRGGSIEFEHDEGTRVMKVLDSKDVLIYQVPPKGELTLIRASEAEAKQAIASA